MCVADTHTVMSDKQAKIKSIVDTYDIEISARW